MRAFAWFFALLLFALAVMALAGYPAWLLLHPHFDFAFHRIASRIAMLAAAAGLWFIARRLGLDDRMSFGYGVPWRRFVRESLIGLALGVPAMAVVAGILALLGLRTWKPELALDPSFLARLLLVGFLRGLSVALLEETCLRGAMFTAIVRESGARAAVLLTALLFAATHFIGRYHIDAQAVTPYSGIELVGGTLRAFAHPAAIADAFACYFALGVVLGVVRALTGNIAACIGLHAGCVWVITFVSETSLPNSSSPLAFLVSHFEGVGDGVVGWLVFAWTILMGALLYLFYARRRGTPGALEPGR
jgi:membrane protease YdiL (CAAX protease family)